MKKMIYQKDRKIELLHNDIYKGYHYYILNLGTHPTAYVELPKESKLFGKGYNDIYDSGIDIEVHGGLTYSSSELRTGVRTHMTDSWFIGWDYAHAGDYMGYFDEFEELGIFTINSLSDTKKWTTEEIIEECKTAIDQLVSIDK